MQWYVNYSTPPPPPKKLSDWSILYILAGEYQVVVSISIMFGINYMYFYNEASSRSSKTNLQRHLKKHLCISLSSLIEFGDFFPDSILLKSTKRFSNHSVSRKFSKAF